MAVDIYARVSQKGDREQRSVGGQAQACRAVLAERGLSEGETFTDDGRSAWNPRVVRPDWERLMTRLESGASGGVIVFDLERFARQPSDGERLITAAERGLVVLDSDQQFDLTSASGKKSFRDAMAAAAYFSDRLSDRTRRGKKLKALNGEVDQRRSFGFESDGVTLKPDETLLIREWATRLLAGEAQETIIRELNDQGIPGVRGARWGYTTFRQIMIRPRTAGLIAHNGQVVARLPGEPILDQATYDRICALYAARRPGRPPSNRYLLTGFAFCGPCGAKLGGRPISGTPHRQYWCAQCRKTFVRAQVLDDWARDWAIRILSDPAHADAVAAQEQATAQERQRIEGELSQAEALATALADRLGRGEITLARYDAATAPLDARTGQLRAELAGLSAEADEPRPTGRNPVTPRDYSFLSWLEVLTEGTPAEQRAAMARALAGRQLIVGPGQPARFTPDRITIA